MAGWDGTTTWYGARTKGPIQRRVEARLAGMDAGQYVLECRAQGMTWAATARMLSEDIGFPIRAQALDTWLRRYLALGTKGGEDWPG